MEDQKITEYGLASIVYKVTKQYEEDWKRIVQQKDNEIENLKKIINNTLWALPVGNINTHTPDTIPERVQDWVKEAAEECRWREKWEACADRLFAWADEVRCGTTNQALYEAVCEDIREYNNLKKEFTDGTVQN